MKNEKHFSETINKSKTIKVYGENNQRVYFEGGGDIPLDLVKLRFSNSYSETYLKHRDAFSIFEILTKELNYITY